MITIEDGYIVITESWIQPECMNVGHGIIGSTRYFEGGIPDVQTKYKVNLETGLLEEVTTK